MYRLSAVSAACDAVALRHTDSCACLACRAAKGDDSAFDHVAELVEIDRKHPEVLTHG